MTQDSSRSSRSAPRPGFDSGAGGSYARRVMGLLDRLPPVSPVAFRRIALVTLVSLVGITLAGATVRLTGSGLGCSTWPTCEPDSLAPRPESGIHGMIEIGNRLVSGLVGVTSLAAVYGAHRRVPRRRDLISWSWQVFGWVVLNAVMGRFVVEHDLLPAVVIVHFLLALVTIWSAVVLHHRAAEATEPASGRAYLSPGTDTRGQKRFGGLGMARHWLLAAAMATIFVGTLVTGSGPHAGDENAERLGLDVGSVARVHGIMSLGFLVVAIWVSWLAQQGEARRSVQERLQWLTLVLVVQGVIGYVQYFAGVPELLVGAHVLGATLVWVAVLRVWLSLSPSHRSPAAETGGEKAAAARIPHAFRLHDAVPPFNTRHPARET